MQAGRRAYEHLQGITFWGWSSKQIIPWLCQATILLKGAMRSWICGVWTHVASPFRRSQWLRKRLRKDEAHELCLSSVKVPTSFTSHSDFFGASEYWFADSLAVLKRLVQQCNLLSFMKHYEAFKWLAVLPCYDAFHRQPQARNNSDLLRSGYAGLIAKIRCSFLLGCCGFWIQWIVFAMQTLHAVIITDHYWPICMLGLAFWNMNLILARLSMFGCPISRNFLQRGLLHSCDI